MNIRNITVLLLCSAALVLSCKDLEEERDPGKDIPYTGKVSVSITVNGGETGTKVALTHDDTKFILTPTWEDGDRLYLATDGGSYIGYMTLASGAGSTSGTFSGEVDSWQDSKKIRVYYLGNSPTISEGKYAFSISSQNGVLDTDEGIAHKYCFMSGITTDAVKASKLLDLGDIELSNMMSVLYLDLSQNFDTSSGVQCSGLYNSGEIDLSTGNLTPGSDKTTGFTLSSGTSKYFMAILPGKQQPVFSGTPVSGGVSSKTMKEEIYFIANKFYTSHGDAIAVADRKVDLKVDSISFVGKTLKGPTITNNGNNYVYVRAAIVGYWTNGSEQVAAWDPDNDGTFVWTVDNPDHAPSAGEKPTEEKAPRSSGKWILGEDGYYYYDTPLQQQKATSLKLFQSYTTNNTVHVSGSKLNINVLVQTVVYDHAKDSVGAVWPDIKDKLYVLTL